MGIIVQTYKEIRDIAAAEAAAEGAARWANTKVEPIEMAPATNNTPFYDAVTRTTTPVKPSSNYSYNAQSPEDVAGTFSFTPDTNVSTTNAALGDAYAGLDYGHHGNRKWYRKYRSWADYWRTTTEAALFGLNGGAPTDELSQLQRQLYSQYQFDKLTTPEAFNPNYNFTNLIGARQKGLTQALNQRAAALGIGDAFQGSMDIATRSRETLVNQAMAAYRPTAWAENQKLQNAQDAMITQMALADIEARKSVAGAGRNAG